MSYALSFCKSQDNQLTQEQITDYLTAHFGKPTAGRVWLVVNTEVEVNFTFEIREGGNGVSWPGFERLGLTAEVELMRPDFFGHFAFGYIDQMIQDLNLFVSNPAVAKGAPYLPKLGELCDNWLATNARLCASGLRPVAQGLSLFYPLEQSNDYYRYCINRQRLLREASGEYYVPRVFLMKRKSDNSVFTMTTWKAHIPTIIPPADFFVIQRQYKKLFRNVEETGLVSRQSLLDRFDPLFSAFNLKGCRIIREEQALLADYLFNTMPLDRFDYNSIERASTERVVNHLAETRGQDSGDGERVTANGRQLEPACSAAIITQQLLS